MPKKEKEKSFLDTVREIDEKERLAELEEENRLSEEKLRRENDRRKAYEEQLRREKVELIKLKKGVISDEDIPKKPEEVKQYTIWEKISNFFYHEKMYLIFGLCAAVMMFFIVYSIVTADRPDMTVLFIATDSAMDYLCEDAALIFQPYCSDVNENGEIMLKMYYVPEELDESNAAAMQMNQAYRTKLVAEFQSGDVIMVIGKKSIYEEMGIYGNGLLQDMTEIYPDDENATDYGYKLSGTTFKETLGYDELSDDLYVSFRTPQKLIGTNEEDMRKNFRVALETFDRYLSENRKTAP